ncbi:MAG: phosphoribosylformylglycinamidine synthase subunit PurQ [Chloroflexi bacterium]|nr:phosphoribosylformylglycinamidine synthase subunit PurQ [Chloroflexota bacterium]
MGVSLNRRKVPAVPGPGIRAASAVGRAPSGQRARLRFGIVVFPGTWSDADCLFAVQDVLGQQARYVWHMEADLSGFDCILLPGGFSYGDYLRAGAIARFSPVMDAVKEFAAQGGLVLGICNGFQVLCEAGLLPGALLRNEHLQFRCQWTHLRVENASSPFTSACQQGQVLRVPISHGEGRYFADPEALAELEREGRVVFRYCESDGRITVEANPNGALNNIAGIINRQGNVLGMMPHPERCCHSLLGGTDGLDVFLSLLQWRARLANTR